MPNSNVKSLDSGEKETCSLDHLVTYIKRFDGNQDGNGNIRLPLRQVQKALAYLSKKCSVLEGFQCKLGTSRELTRCTECPTEIFSSGVILDVLEDTEIPEAVVSSIIQFIRSTMDPQTKTFNFFRDKSIMADDVDTTSVSLWALLNHPEGISREDAIISATAIANNVDSSGVIESFLPPFLNSRGQVDVATLSNVLRILYFLEMDGEYLEPSERFVEHHLKNENCGFGDGIAYYDSVDALLYFLCNAIELNERAERRFGQLIRERLLKRFGSSRHPLDLAMRIITAIKMDMLEDEGVLEEVRKEATILSEMQKPDGSWPKDSLYRYKGWYFGCSAISTAFALKAIKLFAEKVEDF